jgi:hypothetical protein
MSPRVSHRKPAMFGSLAGILPALGFGVGLQEAPADVRAQTNPGIYVPVDATIPDRVEVGTPRVLSDDGLLAGTCVVHVVRSKQDGSDTTPPHDPREHFFQQIPSLGAENIIMQVYFLEKGKVTVVTLPAVGGGDPQVVAVNNRRQLLVSRGHQGGNFYYICDLDARTFTPVGLMATVDEGGTVHTGRLKYLTGLTDDGQVFGAYDDPLGHCAVMGAPTLGAPGDPTPPTAPATFKLLGSAGKGQLQILSINAKGQMTGVADGHAGFLWSDGKLTKFTFPGSVFTTPAMINAAGVVVGIFHPVNDVSDDGQVSNHNVNHGEFPPEKGFVYDGTQFRLVSVPGAGTSTQAMAINDRGQALGVTSARTVGTEPLSFLLHNAFIAAMQDLPLAQAQPSPADYTAAAIAKWRAAPHAPLGSGDAFDQAFVILRDKVDPGAALSWRAFQLLMSEGFIDRPDNVMLSNEFGVVYPRQLNGYQHDAVNRISNLLLDQLALAQQKPEGAEAVVEALGGVIGDAQLEDLKAAKDLSDRAVPYESGADRNARLVGRKKLLEDLRAQVSSHPEPWSSALLPDKISLWQLPAPAPEKLAELVDTVNNIKAQLGNSTAGSFLACEIIRREGAFPSPDGKTMRAGQLVSLRQAASNETDLLFQLQAMSALKQLQATDGAEAALRAVAKAPSPDKCPGVDRLQKGLLSPQNPTLVDRTMVTGDSGEVLLESLSVVLQKALNPFRAEAK